MLRIREIVFFSFLMGWAFVALFLTPASNHLDYTTSKYHIFRSAEVVRWGRCCMSSVFHPFPCGQSFL